MQYRLLRVGLFLISFCLPVHSLADETWTVKPLGGGTYATLPLAIDAKGGDLNGRGIVKIECYGGGDLGADGEVYVTNASAADKFIIEAAEGENPYINVGEDENGLSLYDGSFTEVKGIDFFGDASVFESQPWGIEVHGINAPISNVVIDRCYMKFTGENDDVGVVGIEIDAGSHNVCVIKNCIVDFPTNFASDVEYYVAIAVSTYVFDAITNILTCEIYNTTIKGGLGSFDYYGQLDGGVSATTIVIASNNAAFGVPTNGLCYDAQEIDGGVVIVYQDYCASSDNTATNWGVLNNQINIVAANIFWNVTNDFRLINGCSLRNAGVTVSGVTNDFDGRARPQAKTPDIGVYEMPLLPIL